MAFTNAQKKQHIMELQKYLHGISLFNNKIPLIIPDGFYGKETALAVRAFQREYGLPETGNTDFATWNKIVDVYRELLSSEPIAYDIFPSSTYTLRQGDSGLLVYILEAMLDNIADYYDNMPSVKVDGVFGEDTAEAVRRFQSRTGLPQNGSVDSNTWNVLARTSEHLNKTMSRR